MQIGVSHSQNSDLIANLIVDKGNVATEIVKIILLNMAVAGVLAALIGCILYFHPIQTTFYDGPNDTITRVFSYCSNSDVIAATASTFGGVLTVSFLVQIVICETSKLKINEPLTNCFTDSNVRTPKEQFIEQSWEVNAFVLTFLAGMGMIAVTSLLLSMHELVNTVSVNNVHITNPVLIEKFEKLAKLIGAKTWQEAMSLSIPVYWLGTIQPIYMTLSEIIIGCGICVPSIMGMTVGVFAISLLSPPRWWEQRERSKQEYLSATDPEKALHNKRLAQKLFIGCSTRQELVAHLQDPSLPPDTLRVMVNAQLLSPETARRVYQTLDSGFKKWDRDAEKAIVLDTIKGSDKEYSTLDARVAALITDYL